ncbi:hypothetical protein Tco_1198865, partial [Tanacetum coccineum]
SLSSFITIAKGGLSSILTFFNLPAGAELVLEVEELFPLAGAEDVTEESEKTTEGLVVFLCDSFKGTSSVSFNQYNLFPKSLLNSSGKKNKGVEPTIEVSNSNLFEVLNSIENDDELGTNGGTTNLVNNGATSSGSPFINVDNSSIIDTTPIIDKIRKFKELLTSGQAILVDEAGNPLKKVEFSGDYDSEDEVASVDNDMACSMASEMVGFGTQSLLEQWRDSYGNGDYDDDPYDDDDICFTNKDIAPSKAKQTLASAFFRKMVKDMEVHFDMTVRQKAVFECLRAPHAHDFLLVIPIDGQGMFGFLWEHVFHCKELQGFKYRYNMVRDVFFDVCRRSEISFKKEAPVNFLTDPLDGRSTLRPANVLIFGWVGGKYACADLTGVSPLVGLSSRGFTVGHTILKAASCK